MSIYQEIVQFYSNIRRIVHFDSVTIRSVHFDTVIICKRSAQFDSIAIFFTTKIIEQANVMIVTQNS